MTGALSYLLLTRLKNQVLELFRHPSRLIYALFFVAMLCLTLFTSNLSPEDGGQVVYRSLAELNLVATALFLLIFATNLATGFKGSAALFTLPDVNFVFPAPISPQRALFYALTRQMGTSFLLAFFILFQYSWLHQVYGISYGILLVVLASYALNAFLAQLTSMAIYSLTSGRPKVKRAVQWGIYAIVIGYVLALAFYVLGDSADMLGRLTQAGVSLPAKLFPAVGYISGMLYGIIIGDMGMALMGAGLIAAFIVLLVVLIVKIQPDYYEDVLEAAETSHSAIAARKEGRISEGASQNVKVGKEGLGGGEGANAFAFKHKVENRRARFFALDLKTVLFSLAPIAFALFMTSLGETVVWAVLAFDAYMGIFAVSMGRINREFILPYVYMVPEPAFQKLLACLRESLPPMVVSAVITYVPLYFLLLLPIPTVIALMLAHIAFQFLFLAGNILAQRVFGSVTNKVFIMLFFMLTMIVLSAPGITVGIMLAVMGVVILSVEVTVMLAMSIINVAIALLVLYLCRNVLNYTELNNQ